MGWCSRVSNAIKQDLVLAICEICTLICYVNMGSFSSTCSFEALTKEHLIIKHLAFSDLHKNPLPYVSTLSVTTSRSQYGRAFA